MKKEPRYVCLSEAKASHSQRMWAEVSSSIPHRLHIGLFASPSRWKCLLRVLCPVSIHFTTLAWALVKDKNLALIPRLGPEISSRACLGVPPRLCHLTLWWFTNQRMSFCSVWCNSSLQPLKFNQFLQSNNSESSPSDDYLEFTPVKNL
jgi:hypothetical protein